MSNELERLYRVYRWVEDPFTREGFERYRSILDSMEKVIEHKWVREVVSGRVLVRIIDLCGGTGLAGTALSKKILGLGKDIELTVVDLRRDALEKTVVFGEKELGLKPETIACDALEIYRLGREYDIALLWGYTTPHFSPWDLARLFAGASKILCSNGVFVYEETDRFQSIFIRGYKDFLVERLADDSIVATIHKSRDPLSGYIIRTAVDLIKKDVIDMKVYLWDIASSATLAWMFFENVDFIPKTRYSGCIVAYKPRRTMLVDSILTSIPDILKEKS